MPTPQIEVTVHPEYLPDQSDPGAFAFSFSYTLQITNAGKVAAQLISRHWIITDAHGHMEEVKGLGVVGQQPLLQPGMAFEYRSGCRLRTATAFEVPVARFFLDASGSTSPQILH